MDTIILKRCSKCGEEKNISDFGNCAQSKDRLAYSCKLCCKEFRRVYREGNRDKIHTHNKSVYYSNIDKSREYKRILQKKRYPNIKDKAKVWYKNWAEKNKDKVKSEYIKWRKNNIISAREISMLSSRRARTDLTDSICRAILKEKGFSANTITQELIEVQRLITKTRRLCKTL